MNPEVLQTRRAVTLRLNERKLVKWENLLSLLCSVKQVESVKHALLDVAAYTCLPAGGDVIYS